MLKIACGTLKKKKKWKHFTTVLLEWLNLSDYLFTCIEIRLKNLKCNFVAFCFVLFSPEIAG